MDITKLLRNPDKLKENLVELPDGKVVCKKQCKIYIPARFLERGLAYLGMDVYIIGVYAMTIEDTYYAISTVNAMIPILPTSYSKVKINNEDNYEFIFNAGTTVFKSINLVKTDSLVYKIYDEIFSKGYIPWYLGYDELGHLFDTANKHAGMSIGDNKEVTELIVSMISRDPVNKTQYYRTKINQLSDLTSKPPVFIALRDVTYAATNTTNRLGGSYFHQGTVAALNYQSDRVEKIESLLIS